MKKLLYISYLFPPVGGSGVQRSLKFAKYLPENGWEPIMLVADHRFLKQPKDYSLFRELPSDLLIYRSFAPDLRWVFKVLWGLHLNSVVNWLNRHCLIPDAEILWLPFAKRTLHKIFYKHSIDLVYITAPPYSPLFLGKYIKKKYGVNYCVDLRDPWTIGVGRQYNPLPSWLQKIEKQWEQSILDKASKVICVNQLICDRFAEAYPVIPADKFVAINNGYDESDFQACLQHQHQDRLNIIYTGTLYDLRQPEIIWKALVHLIDEKIIPPAKISFQIYGHNTRSFVLGKYANHPILSNIVKLYPNQAHKQAIRTICKADVLLLFSGSGKSEAMNSPAKLYEYMRSGRPILAVIDPSGAAANILSLTNTCYPADSSSQASIEEQIKAIYHKWETGGLNVQPDHDYVNLFERSALTGKLSRVLDDVIQDKP
jgi:glycosyltransferase involved in cell wall biosynthesis